MAAPKIPAFEDYISRLNMEAVAAAILSEAGIPNLPQDDFVAAKRCIWSAAARWFPRDMRDLKVEMVEQLEFMTVPGVTLPTKMYLDVQGTLTGRVQGSLAPYTGQRLAIDWKTTSGGLDDRWKMRYVDSNQWRIYGAKAKAVVFSYRGISKHYDYTAKRNDTREILLVIPHNNEDTVFNFLRASDIQRQALLTSGLEVWPQDWRRCNDYQRECPYYVDCLNDSMPRFVPKDRPMSYSRLNEFYSCPEQHRRSLAIEDSRSDETDQSRFGVAVHAGLAELYRQAQNITPLT